MATAWQAASSRKWRLGSAAPMNASRLAVALSFLLVAAAQGAKKPPALIDQFYAALGKKDGPKIGTLSDQLVAGDPKNFTLLSMLVRIHSELGDWPRTIDRAGRCLKIQAMNNDCLAARARAFHRTQKYDEEIVDLTALAKVGMGNLAVGAVRSRASVYRMKGDLTKAIADYQAVLQQAPNDAAARWALVEIDVDQGHPDKASAAVRAIGLADPSRAVTGHYDLARLFAAKKDAANAARELDAALAAGYVDRKQLQQDPAFEPIKSAAEYRTMAAKHGLADMNERRPPPPSDVHAAH
jgi:tetratricopeptide (TPR) repeat protein